MENPEFDQGGVTTLSMYEAAADFRAAVLELPDHCQIDYAKQSLRRRLELINNSTGLRGCEVRITSDTHYIDWSHGEVMQDTGLVAMEEVQGTFEGKFIGYIVMPLDDEVTGRLMPALAAVLDTTILDPDIDALQVLIVSPVFPSDIELT